MDHDPVIHFVTHHSSISMMLMLMHYDDDGGIADVDADVICIFDPVIQCVTHHSPIREGTQRM